MVRVYYYLALVAMVVFHVGDRCRMGHADDTLIGQWSLDLPNQEAGWLEIEPDNDSHRVHLMWAVGSARPVDAFRIQGDLLEFSKSIRKPMAAKDERPIEYHVRMRADGDRLVSSLQSGDNAPVEFEGKRQPKMPAAPALATIVFGDPIPLLKGDSLDGWQLSNMRKKNGWSIRDGVLVNSTPKTDFGAYGEYGNLRTEAEFDDFQLHIEFRLPEGGGNSGIYLRGLYEVQVTHRDSSMQGIAGPAAVFGRVKPISNAGKPAGEWESYDITLVDRHVTVVHNGKLVIDNQAVIGCTGGAYQSDVTRPGPIYLQGDHTSVEYRNIVLRPRISPQAIEPAAVLRLWPGKAPGETSDATLEQDQTKDTDKLIAGRRIIKLGNVSMPQISLFRPKPDLDTGSAVVICPGGGHHILAYDLEGTEIAEWLNTIGVTGVVLKYRVPARDPNRRWLESVQDAQRAMSLVRSRAKEWGIDPERIGLCGFSAGGEAAGLTAIFGDERRQYTRVDQVDDVACRPNFALLVYAAGFQDPKTGALRDYLQPSAGTPPMFFVHAADDRVPVENCLLLFTELKRLGVGAELHIYDRGGHGYGLRRTEMPVTRWPEPAEQWLRSGGFLEKPR